MIVEERLTRFLNIDYLVGDNHRLLMEYCNHQKYKISYVPLDPVADYVYISDLILDSVLAQKHYLTKFLN